MAVTGSPGRKIFPSKRRIQDHDPDPCPPCSSATVNTKLPVSPCQLAEKKEYKNMWKEFMEGVEKTFSAFPLPRNQPYSTCSGSSMEPS